MIKTKCINGHYFDFEEYEYCPVCGAVSIEKNKIPNGGKKNSGISFPFITPKIPSTTVKAESGISICEMDNSAFCRFDLDDVLYNKRIGLYDMDELTVIYIGHRFTLNISKMLLSYDFFPHYGRTLLLGGERETIIDNDTMNTIFEIVSRLCSGFLIKGNTNFEDYKDSYTYLVIRSKGLFFSTIPMSERQISGDYLTLLWLFGEYSADPACFKDFLKKYE